MFKFFMLFFAVGLAVIFALNNMHHVQLGLVAGKPVAMRLFFLLLACFLAGCMSTLLAQVWLGVRARRKASPPRGRDRVSGEGDASCV